MAAEVASSRRRVRAGLLAAVLVVVVVAGGGWVVARGGVLGRSVAAAAAAEVPTGTAVVTRTEVVERQQVAGTLGYGDSVTVPGQSQGGGGGSSGGGSGAGGGGQAQGGILTRVPAVGGVVGRGRPLYEVDGHPVPLWYGTRPAWRALRVGMSDGPDVRQLEANLVALSFDPDRAMTVDDHFSWATAAAVKRWQQAIGRAQSGAVALGQVVFLPGPIRVTAVAATVEAPLGAGTAVLTATSVRPDGNSLPGRVAGVGRVATQPGTGTGQNGQDQGQGGNGNGNGAGQATVPVTVALATPHAAANGGLGRVGPGPAAAGPPRRPGPGGPALDQAPVQVAVTTQQHKGVLAVPISALLAQPGGGYAVQVVQGGSRRLVAVRTGLFDDTGGLVEVARAGLAEGARVEVPAS
jgi:hypothetical protein